MVPWQEWYKRCALALCSPDTQAALSSFGGMRFRTLAQRGLPATNVTDVKEVMISDSVAWHLLETHMALPSSSSGKAYKHWLFARTQNSSDPDFDVVQGGATLLMRSVVREHLRREYAPRQQVSLDRTPTGDPDPAGPDAWLAQEADAAATVAANELDAMAQEREACYRTQLNTREKLALAARFLHIPLSAESLLTLAGCGKSTMHATCRNCITRLQAWMERDYPGEDPATLQELVARTFAALSESCAEWAMTQAPYRDALRAHAPCAPVLESTT